jgi:hypothetical protein
LRRSSKIQVCSRRCSAQRGAAWPTRRRCTKFPDCEQLMRRNVVELARKCRCPPPAASDASNSWHRNRLQIAALHESEIGRSLHLPRCSNLSGVEGIPDTGADIVDPTNDPSPDAAPCWQLWSALAIMPSITCVCAQHDDLRPCLNSKSGLCSMRFWGTFVPWRHRDWQQRKSPPGPTLPRRHFFAVEDTEFPSVFRKFAIRTTAIPA